MSAKETKGEERRDYRNPLAKARDAFMESVEGLECLRGVTTGKYLKNRIERAFIAGWHARELSK